MNLSREIKDDLIEKIANQWLESKSVEDLAQFFLDDTCHYLEQYTDEDLLACAEYHDIDIGEEA